MPLSPVSRPAPFSDPATSSKIPALHRAGFQKLAGYARPGDTLTVSELYHSLHVTATAHVHQELLSAAAALNADGASSADRKAYRIYADRLSSAATLTSSA